MVYLFAIRANPSQLTGYSFHSEHLYEYTKLWYVLAGNAVNKVSSTGSISLRTWALRNSAVTFDLSRAAQPRSLSRSVIHQLGSSAWLLHVWKHRYPIPGVSAATTLRLNKTISGPSLCSYSDSVPFQTWSTPINSERYPESRHFWQRYTTPPSCLRSINSSLHQIVDC